MESLKEMWSLVCERLNASCGEVIHDIWFKPLEILSFDGTRAEIAASEFKKKIIVIGNEANGVSDPVKNIADEKAIIPMLGKTESLNASIATGVILYEYVRQKLEK